MKTSSYVSILAGIRENLFSKLWTQRRMAAECHAIFFYSFLDARENAKALRDWHRACQEQEEWHKAVVESRKHYERSYGKWSRL